MSRTRSSGQPKATGHLDSDSESSDSSSTSGTSLTSAEEEGEENKEEDSNQGAPFGKEHPMRSEPRNVSKRMLERLGHPVGHPLRCGPCQGGLFVLNPPPPLAGVVGSYNRHDIGEEVEWRPPLSCANPLGHCVPATPKN